MSEPAPDDAAVALEEGYFRIPTTAGEAPQLIGTRCNACGEHFYPRRETCAKCLSDDTAETLLSPRGTLYTHTFLVAPGFGDNQSKGDGYGVGQIDLPEGPRVQAILLGERGSFRVGMPMEMVLVPMGKDKQGRDLLMYRFRAMEG